MSCTTAALAAAYALRPGAAPPAWMDAMFTIAPGRPALARAKPRVIRYVVKRLESTHARQAAGSESASGVL